MRESDRKPRIYNKKAAEVARLEAAYDERLKDLGHNKPWRRVGERYGAPEVRSGASGSAS